MPVLTNPRHEKFAQLLAQLHGEMTVTDAHEQAGYRRNDGNRSTLARHPDVQARVNEIKARAASDVVVNVKTLIAESELVRLGAMNSHQYAAANGAIKEKAILSGNHIDRAEVGGPGEFDHMSDEELLADLRERWARFNSELQLANSNGSITFDGGRDDE